MRTDLEVVVVGAGLVGLTAALALLATDSASRLRVTVIDGAAQPQMPADGETALRVSAISQGSANFLDELGAWQEDVVGRCMPYDHMRVWDAAAEPEGPATLRFDADEFAVPHLGYIVENLRLTESLQKCLQAAGVEIRYATTLEGMSEINGRRRLQLAGGEELDTDLVVAADGAGSIVRQCAGIDSSGHSYGQTAFVTHLATERPVRATAYQRFLSDGPLGMLPLGEHRISVVWSTRPEHAEYLLDCTEDDLNQALTSASDGVLGSLRAEGRRACFPLHAAHALRYVERGLVLVGDAAHALHPLAGQGANLGIADVATLARVVDQALLSGEHAADRPVLRRYERARKAQNALMMHFLTGLNRLFASDSTLLGELRRTGMTLFNRSGPVRRHVTGIALGAASGK